MGWSLSCPLASSHLSFFACLIADKRGEATLSSVLASHHAAAAAANPFNMGYPFVSPYPTYSNGDPISMPMVSTFSSSMNCRHCERGESKNDPGRSAQCCSKCWVYPWREENEIIKNTTKGMQIEGIRDGEWGWLVSRGRM